MIAETLVRAGGAVVDLPRRPDFGDFRFTDAGADLVNKVLPQLKRVQRIKHFYGFKGSFPYTAFRIKMVDERTHTSVFRGLDIDLTNSGHRQLVDNSIKILEELSSEPAKFDGRIKRFVEWLTILE